MKLQMASRMPAFLDELEKESSIMRDVAMPALRALPGQAMRAAKALPGQAVQAAKAFPGQVAQGVKSLPGHVQGAANNAGAAAGAFLNPVDSWNKGWTRTLHDTKAMSPAWKALMAAGLVSGAAETIPKQDPRGLDRSRLRRAITMAGEQAGGIISAPFGFWGSTVGFGVGRKAGDLAGSAVDRIRRYRHPQVVR